jgi:hypothetical protein
MSFFNATALNALKVSSLAIVMFANSGCSREASNHDSNGSGSDTVKLNLSNPIERYPNEPPFLTKVKTRFGVLAVKDTDGFGKRALYLNDKKIHPVNVSKENESECSEYRIDDLYQTTDKDIVVIGNSCGDTSGIEWYFMMTIDSSGSIASDDFSLYERNKVKVDGKKIIIPQSASSPYKNDKGRMVKDIEAIYDGGSINIIREEVSEKELYSMKESSCREAYDIYKDFVFGDCNSGSACSVAGMSTERACYSFDLGDDLDKKMTSAGNMACQNKNATLNYSAFISNVCGLQ